MTGRRLRKRLARLRRAVTEETKGGKRWSAWVTIMYAEPFGRPRFGVHLHPVSGESFIIGNGDTIRQALRDAESNVKRNPTFGDWEQIRSTRERVHAVP